jgi:hypothetical protein
MSPFILFSILDLASGHWTGQISRYSIPNKMCHLDNGHSQRTSKLSQHTQTSLSTDRSRSHCSLPFPMRYSMTFPCSSNNSDDSDYNSSNLDISAVAVAAGSNTMPETTSLYSLLLLSSSSSAATAPDNHRCRNPEERLSSMSIFSTSPITSLTLSSTPTKLSLVDILNEALDLLVDDDDDDHDDDHDDANVILDLNVTNDDDLTMPTRHQEQGTSKRNRGNRLSGTNWYYNDNNNGSSASSQ